MRQMDTKVVTIIICIVNMIKDTGETKSVDFNFHKNKFKLLITDKAIILFKNGKELYSYVN